MQRENIRNFCILAHVDHGKSTLADRFLELTGTVEKRQMREQFLDQNPLEREKGITIKMQPVRMVYRPQFSILNSQFSMNGGKGLEIGNWKLQNSSSEFILNLIDTPGHVDFSYEVSRALAAVEGAILLVDATQGIQAQTLANLGLARAEGLSVLPTVNKIDLPSAEVGRTVQELSALLSVPPDEIGQVSAKTGAGVRELLDRVVREVPPPVSTSPTAPLRALIFDSTYDPYQGVVAYVRVVDGAIRKGERIQFLATGVTGEALEVGVFHPERAPTPLLATGEIGYIATGMKETGSVPVGDTITRYGDGSKSQNIPPLPGYQEPQPLVFASVFPENQDAYEALRDALTKLRLNDAALSFEPEDSPTFGRGFRAGFLGILHMEIVAERLRREYAQRLVLTNPSVPFRIRLRRPTTDRILHTPSQLPPASEWEWIEEPWARVEVLTPPEYLGAIHTLLSERSGRLTETITVTPQRLRLCFEAPLREVIVDLYDRIKSISQGYASLAYEWLSWRRGDLVRMDIRVAGKRVEAFTEIIPRPTSYYLARARLEKLKILLPRRLFAIALQAEVEGRIIARETIPAMRKDVTGYLYGGDRTRKMKLWKKQQKGKKRLSERAQVEIPPEVFLRMRKD